MGAPTLPDDPLSALDARIEALRAARAAVPRFSDAFWEADDALTWLRTARDEILWTGRVRDAIVALLDVPPALVAIEPDPRVAGSASALATVVSSSAADPDEPIVAA